MRVVIAGVAGVGKSTVLKHLAKNTSYDIINYGTLMFEMAKDIKLVESRDEIRKLNVETQINLQKKAASTIGQMNDVVIDTHMAIRGNQGFLPGLPEWVIRELKVSAFFLLEASPEEIKKRRDNDASRTRDNETVDDIRLHQEVNRMYAVSYSVYTGATVSFINNGEGKPESASEEIVRRLAR
ncbi:MAG: adenylate kinase [Candidatus Thermoplasmatota archaeon]|nr:adenylate kinase [Candidatus Thermoplasmatota archaeon]MCL5790970.1 adenylate kinase [Candidatus Thermoplasmatota archaeon]